MEATRARVIAHIDLDAFYAQVEAGLDTTLKGKPLVVIQYNPFGDLTSLKPQEQRNMPDSNGSAIAVSYEARAFGVKRNMMAQEAKKLCPELNIVQVPMAHGKADLTIYRNAGAQVVDILSRKSVCERASIDEVYLDVTSEAQALLQRMEGKDLDPPVSHEQVHVCAEDGSMQPAASWWARSEALWEPNERLLACGAMVVAEMRAAVLQELGFTCSAGVAHYKSLSKLASGLHKPMQQTVVPGRAALALLSPLPLSKLRQLGGKFGEEIMKGLGVQTVGELLQVPLSRLEAVCGEEKAVWVQRLAHGVDAEEVKPRTLPKSMGCGKTFRRDRVLKDLEGVRYWLGELGKELEERLENERILHQRTPRLLNVQFDMRLGPSDPRGNTLSRSGALQKPTAESIAVSAFTMLKSTVVSRKGWGITSMQITASSFVSAPTGTSTIARFLAKTPFPGPSLTKMSPSCHQEDSMPSATKPQPINLPTTSPATVQPPTNSLSTNNQTTSDPSSNNRLSDNPLINNPLMITPLTNNTSTCNPSINNWSTNSPSTIDPTTANSLSTDNPSSTQAPVQLASSLVPPVCPTAEGPGPPTSVPVVPDTSTQVDTPTQSTTPIQSLATCRTQQACDASLQNCPLADRMQPHTGGRMGRAPTLDVNSGMNSIGPTPSSATTVSSPLTKQSPTARNVQNVEVLPTTHLARTQDQATVAKSAQLQNSAATANMRLQETPARTPTNEITNTTLNNKTIISALTPILTATPTPRLDVKSTLDSNNTPNLTAVPNSTFMPHSHVLNQSRFPLAPELGIVQETALATMPGACPTAASAARPGVSALLVTNVASPSCIHGTPTLTAMPSLTFMSRTHVAPESGIIPETAPVTMPASRSAAGSAVKSDLSALHGTDAAALSGAPRSIPVPKVLHASRPRFSPHHHTTTTSRTPISSQMMVSTSSPSNLPNQPQGSQPCATPVLHMNGQTHTNSLSCIHSQTHTNSHSHLNPQTQTHSPPHTNTQTHTSAQTHIHLQTHLNPHGHMNSPRHTNPQTYTSPQSRSDATGISHSHEAVGIGWAGHQHSCLVPQLPSTQTPWRNKRSRIEEADDAPNGTEENGHQFAVRTSSFNAGASHQPSRKADDIPVVSTARDNRPTATQANNVPVRTDTSEAPILTEPSNAPVKSESGPAWFDVRAADVDASVLAELPEDIRKEVELMLAGRGGAAAQGRFTHDRPSACQTSTSGGKRKRAAPASKAGQRGIMQYFK